MRRHYDYRLAPDIRGREPNKTQTKELRAALVKHFFVDNIKQATHHTPSWDRSYESSFAPMMNVYHEQKAQWIQLVLYKVDQVLLDRITSTPEWDEIIQSADVRSFWLLVERVYIQGCFNPRSQGSRWRIRFACFTTMYNFHQADLTLEEYYKTLVKYGRFCKYVGWHFDPEAIIYLFIINLNPITYADMIGNWMTYPGDTLHEVYTAVLDWTNNQTYTGHLRQRVRYSAHKPRLTQGHKAPAQETRQIASVTTHDAQCMKWRREGSCKFGSNCKFSKDHTTQTKGIEAQSMTPKKKASPIKVKEPMYPPHLAKVYQSLTPESRKIVAAAHDYEPEEGEEEAIRSFFKLDADYDVSKMNEYLDSDSDD